MVNVVVQVEKPYAKKPPLAMGLFVSIDIRGFELADATVIPRAVLRQDDTVWVLGANDKIEFRKVNVARFQDDTVLIRSGLNQNERVVTSFLKAVSDGMKVRPLDLKEENQP